MMGNEKYRGQRKQQIPLEQTGIDSTSTRWKKDDYGRDVVNEEEREEAEKSVGEVSGEISPPKIPRLKEIDV